MNVGQLIKALSKLDPETLVVQHHKLGIPGEGGYDEVWVLDGTHGTQQDGGPVRLRDNRAKFVKGVGKADYVLATPRSRAKKTYPFVVLG